MTNVLSSATTNGINTTPSTFSVPQPIESVAQPSRVPGYAVDIANLLACFKSTNSLSFSEFKQLWKNKRFSLIHKGKPTELEDYEYLNALYSISLCYIILPTPLIIRIGVLYCVYLLYDTQQCSPKIRIPITHGIWRELQKLFREIKEIQLVDAYHVFARLHRNNYYSYVAHIKIAPLSNSSSSHFHRNIHDCLESVNSDRVAHLLDLRHLSELNQRYHQSKVLVADVSEEHQLEGGGKEMDDSLHPLPPSLNVANSQFVEELQDLIENFEREKYLRHPSVPPTTILALNYANSSSASISAPIVISPRVRKGRPPRSSAPLPPSSSPSTPSPPSPPPKSTPKGRRRAQSWSTPPPHEEQIPQTPQPQQDKGKEKDDDEEEDLGGELQHMPSLSLIGLTPSFSSSSSSSLATTSTSTSSFSTPSPSSKGGRNANKRPRTKK